MKSKILGIVLDMVTLHGGILTLAYGAEYFRTLGLFCYIVEVMFMKFVIDSSSAFSGRLSLNAAGISITVSGVSAFGNFTIEVLPVEEVSSTSSDVLEAKVSTQVDSDVPSDDLFQRLLFLRPESVTYYIPVKFRITL